MTYVTCSNCGENLAILKNRLETSLKEECNKLNLNFSDVLLGTEDDKRIVSKKSEIIRSFKLNYCCNAFLLTYVDIVEIHKPIISMSKLKF